MGDGVIPLLCIVALLQVLTTVQQLIVFRAVRRTLRPPPPVGPAPSPPLELEPTLVQRYVQRARDSLHSLRPRPRRRRRTHDDSEE